MTACLSLMKSVLTPLAKNVLSPLGLTAALSATDAAIQKKVYGSRTTGLITLCNKLLFLFCSWVQSVFS